MCPWDGAAEYGATVKDRQVLQATTVTDYSIRVKSFASTFLGGDTCPPVPPLDLPLTRKLSTYFVKYIFVLSVTYNVCISLYQYMLNHYQSK